MFAELLNQRLKPTGTTGATCRLSDVSWQMEKNFQGRHSVSRMQSILKQNSFICHEWIVMIADASPMHPSFGH